MMTQASGTVRKKTVLIVDDDEVMRRLLYHSIGRECRVLEAGDAASAIEALLKEPVDLVLLDLHLPPDVDSPVEGLRVQRRIGEFARSVPIVVITSDEDPGLRKTLIDGGVRDVLLKPVASEALEAILAGLKA